MLGTDFSMLLLNRISTESPGMLWISMQTISNSLCKTRKSWKRSCKGSQDLSEALLELQELLLPQFSRIPGGRWWGRNCSPRAPWFSSAAPANVCGENRNGLKPSKLTTAPNPGKIQRIKLDPLRLAPRANTQGMQNVIQSSTKGSVIRALKIF